MENEKYTYMKKMQESTREIFLLILCLLNAKVKSKNKYITFSWVLSSSRRNKYVKMLIFHFLRLLSYQKFFLVEKEWGGKGEN